MNLKIDGVNFNFHEIKNIKYKHLNGSDGIQVNNIWTKLDKDEVFVILEKYKEIQQTLYYEFLGRKYLKGETNARVNSF